MKRIAGKIPIALFSIVCLASSAPTQPQSPGHSAGRSAASAENPTRHGGRPPASGNRSGAPPSFGPEIVRTLDVQYARVPGAAPRLTSLDIHAPKDARGLPVVIYIHGGGWTTGDKARVGAKPAYFTSRGFVFVSINYRLLPAVDLLTQLQDSANAIGWVAKHIAKYGGDPRRLHLFGHSAGAHHVAILATNERFLSKAGVEPARLKSALVLDTQALDVPTLMRRNVSPIYERAFGRDPALWQQVSPLHHVAKAKHIPPFVLVVAENRLPKLRQARAFQEALREADTRCELVEAPQHTHASLNRAIGVQSDRVTQALDRFYSSLSAGEDNR